MKEDKIRCSMIKVISGYFLNKENIIKKEVIGNMILIMLSKVYHSQQKQREKGYHISFHKKINNNDNNKIQ